VPGGTTARTLAPSKEAFDAPLSPPPLDDEPGPATGLSGVYPDGTLTRWLGPVFRTQHDGHCRDTTGHSAPGVGRKASIVRRWSPPWARWHERWRSGSQAPKLAGLGVVTIATTTGSVEARYVRCWSGDSVLDIKVHGASSRRRGAARTLLTGSQVTDARVLADYPTGSIANRGSNVEFQDGCRVHLLGEGRDLEICQRTHGCL